MFKYEFYQLRSQFSVPDLSLTFSTIQYKVGKVGDLVSQDKDQVGQGQGQELDNY